MVPLFVLVISFVILYVFLKDWRAALRWALFAMLMLTASAHWGSRRADLIAMVPPQFPRPDLIVTITGILEIAGAIGLQWERTRRAAAYSLALLLVAMFPANIHAAQQGLSIGGRPATELVLRLPMQLLFIAALLASATSRSSDKRAVRSTPHPAAR